MAERSFAQEVEQLRLTAGQEFRGEGILAITKALLQCGVGYVAGYQGAPISHLMDVLSDAQAVLDELGVRFDSSANEATAAATLSASVMYPIRGAVAWKAPVGTNVASDALANLTSSGVRGGALIIIGEDYGEGSSIMQERSHAFAMKSQIWLLDPRPNLPSIVQAVESGFELSEASNTPVMLEMRIRSCHLHGSFIAKDNRPPAYTLKQALENPVRDTNRIVLPPASFMHEKEKIEQRWPAALEYIRSRGLNERFGPAEGPCGIILQGGLYNGVIRALTRLGLADCYGESRIPLYVLNVTYPLVEDELVAFCKDKTSVLVVEEGQPDFLEQAITTTLQRAGCPSRVAGKGTLPAYGEYTTAALIEGFEKYISKWAPGMVSRPPGAPAVTASAPWSSRAAAAIPSPSSSPRTPQPTTPPGHELAALSNSIPARPAGFCTGCPERPIFAALKLAEKELGPHHVAADIGCHLFSILPPFHIGHTTMGYGMGAASAAAFNVPAAKRSISVMGDGGFWHNGLSSGVANAVYNKSDNVILIVDNYYSAATGGQDVLSSRATNARRLTNNPIVEAVKGVGVKWVRKIGNTYDVGQMLKAFREALTSKEPGPKVIVASSECMLNRQRREKPLQRQAIARGERVVRTRFGVDEDVCTGDHACIRLSGCPSLTVKSSGDPLKEDPVASIDQSCVGCGNCGEVAEAAVLCPSFYRADIVSNPRRGERLLARARAHLIAFFQRRRERNRIIAVDAT
jgi:indolepyruvate ferredoxin oxidoreductase alpha subunit